MPYTNPRQIERQRALAMQLSSQPQGIGRGASIAHILRNLGAYQGGRAASRSEEENQRIRQREMAALLGGLQGDAAPAGGMGPVRDAGNLPQFESDVGEMAAMHQLGMARDKAKGKQQPPGPTSSILDYEYYQQLKAKDPALAKEFLLQKRQQQFLNTGGGFTKVDPTGGESTVIPKTLTPSQDPDYSKRIAQDQENVRLSGVEAQHKLEVPHAAAMAGAKVKGTQEETRKQKLVGTKTQREMVLKGKTEQLTMLNRLIDKAIGQASGWTTGIGAATTSWMPMTPAHDLSNTLKTIKANIGFDKLQSMRESSPTGGALGQVTEFENELLQAVWGALAQSQSQEQFEENLNAVREQVKRSWENIAAAYEQDYGVAFDMDSEFEGDIMQQALDIINAPQ